MKARNRHQGKKKGNLKVRERGTTEKKKRDGKTRDTFLEGQMSVLIVRRVSKLRGCHRSIFNRPQNLQTKKNKKSSEKCCSGPGSNRHAWTSKGRTQIET